MLASSLSYPVMKLGSNSIYAQVRDNEDKKDLGEIGHSELPFPGPKPTFIVRGEELLPSANLESQKKVSNGDVALVRDFNRDGKITNSDVRSSNRDLEYTLYHLHPGEKISGETLAQQGYLAMTYRDGKYFVNGQSVGEDGPPRLAWGKGNKEEILDNITLTESGPMAVVKHAQPLSCDDGD